MEYENTNHHKTVYELKNKKFIKVGIKCIHCELNWKENHLHNCKVLNNVKKRKEFMPIHKTEKGYYWGSKGPFPTRKKAKEVQRAAYASGYKETRKTKSKDSNK